MSVTNPSFETAGGTPGSATGWTFTTVATASELAGYDSGVQSAEDFESQWSTNEAYVYAFSVNMLSPAEFQTAAPTSKLVENFEEFWSANQSYVYGLGNTTAAVYEFGSPNPQDFEDFEQNWSSNQNYMTSLGAVTVATYDGEAYEDFEEQWSSNQSYVYAFTNGVTLSAAFLDTFEGTWSGMSTV